MSDVLVKVFVAHYQQLIVLIMYNVAITWSCYFWNC